MPSSALAPKYKFCDMGARFANTGVGIPASPFGNQVREKKQPHFVAHKQNKCDHKEVIQLIEKESQQRMKCLINHVDQTVHPSPTTFSAPPTVASKPESNSSIVACDSIRAQVNKATCTADKISLLIGATKDIRFVRGKNL